MSELQYMLVNIFGLAVTFFVPVVVWVVLTVGLYQWGRDKIRGVRVMPRRSQWPVREAYGQQTS